MKHPTICLIITVAIIAVSCKGNNEKTTQLPTSEKNKNVNDTVAKAPEKGPIINIIDTVEIKRTVLCTKDSAATIEGLNEKLATIFNKKLPEAATLGKLKITGAPIVWYKSKKAPYFFQAGIPVDKAAAKLAKGMFMGKTGGDSAMVAHFFGPNNLSSIGYEALNDMLKENKKKKTTDSYEVYIDNKFLTANEKTDPYKLQTDIVMPYK